MLNLHQFISVTNLKALTCVQDYFLFLDRGVQDIILRWFGPV